MINETIIRHQGLNAPENVVLDRIKEARVKTTNPIFTMTSMTDWMRVGQKVYPTWHYGNHFRIALLRDHIYRVDHVITENGVGHEVNPRAIEWTLHNGILKGTYNHRWLPEVFSNLEDMTIRQGIPVEICESVRIPAYEAAPEWASILANIVENVGSMPLIDAMAIVLAYQRITADMLTLTAESEAVFA